MSDEGYDLPEIVYERRRTVCDHVVDSEYIKVSAVSEPVARSQFNHVFELLAMRDKVKDDARKK